MSKEERRRRRQERREREVVDALEALRFLKSQGIEPVVTPDGKELFYSNPEGIWPEPGELRRIRDYLAATAGAA